MLKKLYVWLFSEEERQPVGFIPLFAMIIIISVSTALFIMFLGKSLEWI